MKYTCYLNVLVFAEEWRKFKITSKKMTFEAFRTALYKDSYIKIECKDFAKSRDVIIFMFEAGSKYIISNQDMKRLLKYEPIGANVILISHDILTTYHRKYIATERRLKIQSACYTNFAMILPNGPLCYKHRILSHAEILNLANNSLCIPVLYWPKIYDTDPQCLWIGAEIGDVLEITMYTDTAGEVINYRVVVPKNGRMVAYQASEEPKADQLEDQEDQPDDPQDDQDDQVDDQEDQEDHDDPDQPDEPDQPDI
jgi:DNA-directed RNA polymerase subunit H (RpoH/RPB5)